MLALRAGAAAALMVLGLQAGAWAQAAVGELAVTEVAPGVWVHAGRHEETGPDNAGDIANIGFVVGERCVAVVDTGGSAGVGRALRAAIARVTPRPVCYVINTHVHPDHIFGNAAFAADRPVFVGHAKLALAMAARGRNYLNALQRDAPRAGEGTELVPPTQTVSDTLRLDLGNRSLLLRAWPTAHTDNDLTVLDEASGTLWLGDLAFQRHTPSLDGSLRGWLKVLDELTGAKVTRVVCGHGPASAPWPAAADDTRRYLTTLLTETRAAIKDKRTLPEAVKTVGLGEAGRWELFDRFHRRNVTAAYAELEWED